MKRYFFWLGIFGPAVGMTIAVLWTFYNIAIWQYDGPDTYFTIQPGEAFSSINHRLNKEEMVSSPKLFYRFAKARGDLTKFRAGTFKIQHNSTMLMIMETLTEGKSIDKQVTIPEGKNLYQIAEILEKASLCDASKFIKEAKSEELARSLKIPAATVEGYLFPDTYNFPPYLPEESIIRAMVGNFRRQTKDIDYRLSPLKSLHQLVTLASIVEKETGAAHERPVIAGVFYNRLRKKMRLQSDPTTIYGIWEEYNGDLKKRHLLTATPYNTYKIAGLPKGPIANPGIHAIKAVLNPELHSYLYFVSQNDGTHIFSKTYKDHNKAVEKFQKTRSNRVGKSWRNYSQKTNKSSN